MRSGGGAEGDGGITLAAVGDCITSRPLAPRAERDTGFRRVVEAVRGVTTAVGNLETSVFDLRSFRGHARTVDDWGLVATPDAAADLAELGFGLVSRANNHAMDWGIEGMRETGRWLDAAGLVHAGAGETLASARAPRYRETPLGRVGLVSFAPTLPWDQDAALDVFGEVPGRPGINALRLRRRLAVPRQSLDVLRELARLVEPWTGAMQEDDAVTFLDTRFAVGDRLDVSHELDANDRAAILGNVRLAGRHADVVVVSAHVHEYGRDQATPPAFLVDLAHEAVEAGADVFVGHGVHCLWPVEVHAGRPILYGLGDFIWSDLQEALHAALDASGRSLLRERGIDPATATAADVNDVLNDAYVENAFFESVVAEVSFDGGAAALRLHPIELGRSRPLTERGIPRLAEGRGGELILERLAEISEPLGTKIRISGGVGLVDPS